MLFWIADGRQEFAGNIRQINPSNFDGYFLVIYPDPDGGQTWDVIAEDEDPLFAIVCPD